MKVRVLAMLATGVAGPAAAQSLPTTFEIAEHPIQKVPTTFKFQAKVSQGKIPTGDATFEKVFVNLKRGSGEVLCTETLNRVKVRDSVINLELGRGMSCQLDEVVANNADLSFQICVNNTDSCLKPIALSTVPFAVKSTFAAQAQEAHKSDVAAQAHYTHRASADADLFLSNRIGSGYYDFHTPATAEARTLSGGAQEGGFFQWTGVGAANKLNMCAKDEATGQLKRLDDVAIHSNVTRALGELRVSADTRLGANLEVAQTARVGTALDVGSDAQIGGSADIHGAARVGTTLEVFGNTSVGGSLAVLGSSSFAAGSTATFAGDVVFSGSVTLPSGNIVAGDSVNGAAVVDGSLSAADLAAESVLSAQVADGTLMSIDIADGTLQSIDIADGAIASVDLANQSVVGSKIAGGAVSTGHLADGSVTEVKLATGAVSSRALGDGAVTGSDLAANSVSSGHIVDGQVTSADIQDGAVGYYDLGNSQIYSAHITDGQVTSADIADNSISGYDIGGGAINNWHIADGQVTSADLTDNNVTSVDIANKTITTDDVQFSPRRVNFTFTAWQAYYPSMFTYQYSVCTLVSMMGLDASQNGSCNMLLTGNQWYMWGYQATCGYLCF